MNFIDAVRAVGDGAHVTGEPVNGEPKQLVSQCGSIFVRTPRSIGAKSDNYIFTSPSVEEILSDEWRTRQ